MLIYKRESAKGRALDKQAMSARPHDALLQARRNRERAVRTDTFRKLLGRALRWSGSLRWGVGPPQRGAYLNWAF